MSFTEFQLCVRPSLPRLLGGACVAAHADQLQDIIQRKELRCGTFADVPPFAAPDPKTREMVGFDVDLCGAIAKHLGVTATITPLSVEARVPEVKLGHVDIAVANLAYTLGRADQIQFSDPYYIAKEMLAVKARDPGKTKADFKGKRLASTKGSDVRTVDQAQRLRSADFPGHRLGLHGRSAEQGGRHGGQHDDDHQAGPRIEEERCGAQDDR